MFSKRPRFELVEPGRWGRLQFLIALTISGAVLPNLFFPLSMARTSYWESYHEVQFHFLVTIVGALIGAGAAILVFAVRNDQRLTCVSSSGRQPEETDDLFEE